MTASTISVNKGVAVPQPGSQLKTRKRRERRLKQRFGKRYVPLHERVVTGLKSLINEEFPVGDKSQESQACRAYWLSHVTDITEELNAEVWDVDSIVAERWRHLPDGQAVLEFDTRYVGHEDEVSWQPYEYVQHLTVLADYITSRANQ